MNCQTLEDFLKTYEQGGSLKNLSEAYEHLLACEDCGKRHSTYVEAFRVILNLKEIPVPDPGPEFWQEMPGKIRTKIAQKRVTQTHSRFWKRRFGITALAATACAILIFFLYPFLHFNGLNVEEQNQIVLDMFSEPTEDVADWDNLQMTQMSQLYAQLLSSSLEGVIQENGAVEIVDTETQSVLDTNWSNDIENLTIEELSDQEFENLINQLEYITL